MSKHICNIKFGSNDSSWISAVDHNAETAFVALLNRQYTEEESAKIAEKAATYGIEDVPEDAYIFCYQNSRSVEKQLDALLAIHKYLQNRENKVAAIKQETLRRNVEIVKEVMVRGKLAALQGTSYIGVIANEENIPEANTENKDKWYLVVPHSPNFEVSVDPNGGSDSYALFSDGEKWVRVNNDPITISDPANVLLSEIGSDLESVDNFIQSESDDSILENSEIDTELKAEDQEQHNYDENCFDKSVLIDEQW